MKRSFIRITNKIAQLSILSSWFCVSNSYAEGELPADSQRLIQLLQRFEQREQKKLDYQIEKKRKEVLALLRKHLKQRTRNGQLDQALAIRKEIMKLETLLTSDLTNRVVVSSVTYLKNGVKSEVKADSYIIDTDHDGGKLTLHFKHEDLGKLFNSFKKIHLELTIAHAEYADSRDSAILRHRNRTLATKKGLKLGEVVKLSFDPWKIVRIGTTLSLKVENSGTDGFVVIGGKGKSSPALVFEN